MMILSNQELRSGRDITVGENVIVGVGRDDLEPERRRHAKQVAAGYVSKIHEAHELSPATRAAQSRQHFLILQKNRRGYGPSNLSSNPGIQDRMERVMPS